MSYTIKKICALEYINILKNQEPKILIDAVITDPPYNISRQNNFSTIGRSGIDFGPWDYGFDQSTWIKSVSPLIKDGGSIIIFNDYKNFGEICKALIEANFNIKDVIRWIKKNPMPRNVTRRYVTDYEFAIWAVKGNGKWTFNKPPGEPYLRPEFRSSIVSNGKNKIHPTQKSLDLMKYIIEIHTNEGDTIFDPFMGSGTTGVAAIEMKRIFIGTEIDEKYFKLLSKRLLKAHTRNIESKKVNRSPLYYLGDKYKLLPQIYSFFPKKIETFYDVFGGGGTVIASVIAKNYVYNDIDKNVTLLVKLLYENSYLKIIRSLRSIIKKYSLVDYKELKNKSEKQENKNRYNNLKRDYNNLEQKDTFDAIIMLFVLVIFGFNSQIRFNSKGEFNIPYGKQDLNKNRDLIIKKYVNSIRNKKIIFKNEDFHFVLSEKFQKNDFLYFDPPYFLANATYNSIWSADKDKELFRVLDELNERRVKWALSNVLKFGEERVNMTLKEWAEKYYYIHKLDFNYNNSNYGKKEKGTEEVLITNYIEQ